MAPWLIGDWLAVVLRKVRLRALPSWQDGQGPRLEDQRAKPDELAALGFESSAQTGAGCLVDADTQLLRGAV